MDQFAEIVGHKNQVSGLKKAVVRQRVAHAYLFYGPEGIGKKTTARAFAAALLCNQIIEGDACGFCSSCRQISNNNHPDLFLITPQGASIKIEQIRDIQKKVIYKPYQNKYQVFIFEASETMTIEAANCFLKVLEEPPEQSIFILITSKPDLLPATVVSRCQGLSFKTLTYDETCAGLVKLTGKSYEEARLPALMSRGSLGKALNYVTDASSLNLRERVINVSGLIRNKNFLELLSEVSFLADNKDSALETVNLLLIWYRDLLIYKLTENQNILFNQDKFSSIKEEAGHYTTEALIKTIEQLEISKRNLMYNGNPRLVLDVLFLGLTGFKERSSEYVL